MTQRANQCLHHNECFLQTPRRMDHFSLCSHGVGDVFIQHFPNSRLFLSDRVCLDREFLDGARGPCCCSAQICSLFFLSPFLCPSFCVPLLLRTYIEMVGYWSWILCSTESLKSLGVYNSLSMTDLWGEYLCSELGPALQLSIHSRALQDQGIEIFCGTLPEITSLLDFIPSLLFLLPTTDFFPRNISLKITCTGILSQGLIPEDLTMINTLMHLDFSRRGRGLANTCGINERETQNIFRGRHLACIHVFALVRG